jgi:serine/threonine protein kinase
VPMSATPSLPHATVSAPPGSPSDLAGLLFGGPLGLWGFGGGTERTTVIAGRYELVREIGRGGMGAVWLGRDTVLGRDVALKRIGLLPGAQPQDLERAGREARLAAQLNHPHVVAVYDLVEEDDYTWLVMEYVEGITLSALVKRDGALRPDQAAPLVRQAADALAAAHQVGIIHRDVKPSNILVSPDGEVKLTDFGIARAEADASLTQTGLVTGSPAYLAPEVASGVSATDAADVWSLGATLFHLLAGQPPYNVQDNVMGALYRIVHEEPPRLSRAGWLSPALEHTMTREPRDRWSMTQVRDFLDRGHDVAIHPVPATTLDEQTTRELRTTPPTPVGVPPVAPAQPLVSAVRPSAPPARARRSRWPLIAVVAVLLAVALVAGAVYLASRGDDTPSASAGSSGSGPSSPSSSDAAQISAMRSFITTYLAKVTVDQDASWAMLTQSFQTKSGGFGKYQQFWQMFRSATPRNITADPAAMTVTYDVDYVKTDDSTTSDHVTLDLLPNGSSYLINGET